MLSYGQQILLDTTKLITTGQENGVNCQEDPLFEDGNGNDLKRHNGGWIQGVEECWMPAQQAIDLYDQDPE